MKSKTSQSDLKQTDLKLVDQKFLFEILDHSGTPLFVKNRQHQLVLINNALCELVGLDRSAMIGRDDYDLYSEKEAAGFFEADELVFESREPFEYEEIITDSNNVTKSLRTTKNVFETSTGELLLVGTVHDITELRATQNQLEDAVSHLSMIALTDSLTGLSNRTQFENDLEDLITGPDSEDVTFSVVFIDLNGFKVINDTAGHLVGDEVLKICSQRLRNQLRRESKIARVGGDEFVLLLPNTDALNANVIVNRIMDTFRAPIRINRTDWNIACSVGVALYPQDGVTSADLIRNADFAMYEAKKRKHNDGGGVPCSTVEFFRPQIGNAIERRREIECALNFSLSGNQIEQYYQPIVSCDANGYQIRGFESLARWQLAGKPIPPDEFIPILNSGGGIVPFGYQIIESACQFLSKLDDHQYVSVNLTYKQILDGDFCEIVAAIIHNAGIRPSRLALELTEQDANTEKLLATSVFEKLRRMGVQIMIDDFGCGYSNLGRLGDLPIDVVKIDKSLIHDNRLLKSVLSLVRELGLDTVVEGIETQQLASNALSFGADILRGYYFGRPQPADYDWGARFLQTQGSQASFDTTKMSLQNELQTVDAHLLCPQ